MNQSRPRQGFPRVEVSRTAATGAALLLAGLLTACGDAAPAAPPSTAPASATPAVTTASPTPSMTTATSPLGSSSLPSERPADYAIEILAGGTHRGYLTVSALDALPQVTIDTPTAGMPQQTGGTVRAVLEAAGVRTFTSLVVTGPNGTSTVAAADLDDTYILGVSKRQTIRFSGERLDKDSWVQDVTTIEITL